MEFKMATAWVYIGHIHMYNSVGIGGGGQVGKRRQTNLQNKSILK